MTQAKSYLSFTLNDDFYAIDLENIQEIQSYKDLSIINITNRPQYIKGIIHLHNEMIPIIDLRVLYHLGPTIIDEYNVVIIINITKESIGLLVDRAHDIVKLTMDAINMHPNFIPLIKNRYIQGIGFNNEQALFILDTGKLVESSELHEY